MLRQSRSRPDRRRAPCPSPVVLLAACGLLLLAVGCAPKRVVRGEIVRGTAAPAPVTSPAVRPGPPPPAADAGAPPTAALPAPPVAAAPTLPDPEPRGPAGAQMPERIPESVTMGVEAATLARAQLGKPYQWGASGPDRFDCSGLVQHVYGSLGIDLPRISRDQAAVGAVVRRSELQAGDLVFFALNGDEIDHVGIYVGADEFIHAPRRYVPVSTESLDNSWWRRRFRQARRLR